MAFYLNINTFCSFLQKNIPLLFKIRGDLSKIREWQIFRLDYRVYIVVGRVILVVTHPSRRSTIYYTYRTEVTLYFTNECKPCGRGVNMTTKNSTRCQLESTSREQPISCLYASCKLTDIPLSSHMQTTG